MSHPFPKTDLFSHHQIREQHPRHLSPTSKGQPLKFPFSHGPEVSSYQLHYPYPHPSSLINSYNPYCMPPYPYYPYPYLLPPSVPQPEQKKKEKKVKKEVIDLESVAQVKTQYEELQEKQPSDDSKKGTTKQLDEENLLWLCREHKNKTIAKRQSEPLDTYELRTSILQKVFKRLIQTMVTTQKSKLEAVKKQFKTLLRQQKQLDDSKESFFDLLVSVLWSKFQAFKKTKEEIIKYIIRRTYHNAKIRRTSIYKSDFQKLQHFHDKNLNLHRSMNTEFMKKEFSNKLFVTIFKEFIYQMDEQFERENGQRISRFAVTISSAWIQQSITMVQYEKKLPWVQTYKSKIKTVALELLKSYQHFGEKDFLVDKVQ